MSRHVENKIKSFACKKHRFCRFWYRFCQIGLFNPFGRLKNIFHYVKIYKANFKKGCGGLKILVCDDDAQIVEDICGLIAKRDQFKKTDFQIEKKIDSDFISQENEIYDIAFVDINFSGGGSAVYSSLKS